MADLSTTNRPTSTRFAVIAFLCAAAAIAYIQRNGISAMESTIRKDLELSLDQSALILASFFWGYAVFQVPAGWLGDVLGSRRGLALFCFLWSLATGLSALSAGWITLLVVRFASGGLQAAIFPCCASTLARWTSPTARAAATGYLAGCMSVGGALASAIAGVLLTHLDWRTIFALFALPGFVWALAFFFWFRDDPRDHANVNAQELELIRAGRSDAEVAVVSGPTPWHAIMTNRDMWFICAQQFFRAAGYIFYANWLPTFLQEARGVSIAKSGVLSSLPMLAVVAGAPIGGMISDWLLKQTGSRRIGRQGVPVVALLCCTALTSSAFFIADPAFVVIVICAATFFAAFAGPAAYTVTIDMGGRHVGTVFSVMNMAGNIGAAVFPMLVPYLVRVLGGWNQLLLSVAAIHLSAAVFWCLVNPAMVIRSSETEGELHA